MKFSDRVACSSMDGDGISLRRYTMAVCCHVDALLRSLYGTPTSRVWLEHDNLSLAFALTRLESGLLGPIQGWLVDRFGPRKILTIGLIIFAIGFFLFSQVNTIPVYFLAFILIALGAVLGYSHGSYRPLV